jgi:hypothetical protein
MNVTLRRADGHHTKAQAMYRQYLIDTARKCGSVASMAARCGIPVTTVHNAMNEKSGYIATRNMAHEIMRKLDKAVDK